MTKRKWDSGLVIQKQASIRYVDLSMQLPHQYEAHGALLYVKLQTHLGCTHPLILWLLPGSKFAAGILVAFFKLGFIHTSEM